MQQSKINYEQVQVKDNKQPIVLIQHGQYYKDQEGNEEVIPNLQIPFQEGRDREK